MSTGKTPLELLLPDPNRKPTFLSDKFNPIIGALFGFGAVCYMNWGIRRPVFSGIPKHILAAVIGGALGTYFDNKRNAYLAERDAVFRHYIELHPEDFQPPERKKIGELFLPWDPVR